MLGQPQESLLKILVEKGFPKDLSRLEIQTAASHPYLAAAQSLARQRAKRDWLLHTWRKLEQIPPRRSVNRRVAVDPEEFVSEYYCENRPVIIADVLSRWPAIEKWNHAYLDRLLGDVVVEYESVTNQGEGTSRGARMTARFSELLQAMFCEPKVRTIAVLRNDLEANSEVLNTLKLDIDCIPEFLNDESDDRLLVAMSSVGSVLSLRHELENRLMAQVIGRTRIRLISPVHLPLVYNDQYCISSVDLDAIDYDHFPDFREVHIEEVVVEPGELFFLPVSWWYHMTVLDPSLTIVFSNFRQENTFANYYNTFGVI